MIYALRKFRHYLLGNKVLFHVDHQALLYLIKKPQLVGWLACWMLLLQEFDFNIVHTPGKMHAIADFLSRLESDEPADGIPDELLDADIYSSTVSYDSWYDQLLIFLLDGSVLAELSVDQRKKFVLHS